MGGVLLVEARSFVTVEKQSKIRTRFQHAGPRDIPKVHRESLWRTETLAVAPQFVHVWPSLTGVRTRGR